MPERRREPEPDGHVREWMRGVTQTVVDLLSTTRATSAEVASLKAEVARAVERLDGAREALAAKLDHRDDLQSIHIELGRVAITVQAIQAELVAMTDRSETRARARWAALGQFGVGLQRVVESRAAWVIATAFASAVGSPLLLELARRAIRAVEVGP